MSDDALEDKINSFELSIPREVRFESADDSDRYIYQHIGELDKISRVELELLYYASIQRLILLKDIMITAFFTAEQYKDDDLKIVIRHIYRNV